jgi:hypothetical protein
MRDHSQRRNRIVRRAAIPLAACVILIFGFTCIMMQSTVWNSTAIPAAEPFYTTLPGVDLRGVPAAKLPALLKQLNTRRCPCECLRTVASCRNHHGTCSFSLAIAKEATAAIR